VEGGMSGVRAGLLFWVLVIVSVGFARYFFLARKSGDLQLALAAAVAFFLVPAAALMVMLEMLR
jgi:hypothetical protein